jgi:hypothetical protein
MQVKGFVFTVDAIIAMISAGFIIMGAMFFLTQSSDIPFHKQDLQLSAMDALAILERDGSLNLTVVRGEYSNLTKFMNAMAPHICANIKVYNVSYSTFEVLGFFVYENKTDCDYDSEESAVTRRIFVARNKTYFAEMETWYK